MAAYQNIGEVAAQFNRAPFESDIAASGVLAEDYGDPPVAFDAALVRRTPFDLRAQLM